MTDHTNESGPDERAAAVATPGVDTVPYIKQMPSRRRYDLLLLLPFLCVGASIGTLAMSTGLFRHLALLCSFGVLLGWVKAGLATTRSAYANWLLVMWGAVGLFGVCAMFARVGG